MGVYLFKNTACALLLLLTLQGAYASVFVVEPVEATLNDNGSVQLGSVAFGETLKVIVQRKSNRGFEWSNLILDSPLPPHWDYTAIETDETLVALITVPRDAEESVQKISLRVENEAQPFASERFSLYVTVKRNLLNASMEALKQSAMVGEKAVFRLFLNNDSIAEQTVAVSSTLPEYWFEGFEAKVPPNGMIDLNVVVNPKSYGVKRFQFSVHSKLNGFNKGFQAELHVFSTLKGKLSSPLFGFPFFTVSMLPHLILNAFLALAS